MPKEDGGPAFPVPLRDGEIFRGEGSPDGLTIRDWFAGMALQGLAADNPSACETIAGDCYDFADAMLVARKVDR